jgi:hypothetical protein
MFCVISGSFGANLAKFVTSAYDGTGERFGSTAFELGTAVFHAREGERYSP